MKSAERRISFALLGTAAAVALSACSVLEPDKIDYKSSGRGVSLEVPPDLSQLPGQSRYAVSSGTVTATGYQAGQAATQAAGTPTAANQIADVQFMRQDGERWLRVDRTPDKLWGSVRDFWLESGFLMAVDQANMGLMETDWAENRAKIPQDFIRNTIGKVFDSLYSTGERDKFRTRLERNANGGTDIFVTHRGMEEVYSSARRDSTVWQPRARDPELEAEFMRRMMVKLGVSQEQAKAALATAATTQAAAPNARVVAGGGPRPAVRRPCNWRKTLTAPGAAWGWRSIAPASPWKTATAARACTSCATSTPRWRRKKPASSAACSAAAASSCPPASTRSPCAAKARAAS